jgi:hypothetical protein
MGHMVSPDEVKFVRRMMAALTNTERLTPGS